MQCSYSHYSVFSICIICVALINFVYVVQKVYMNLYTYLIIQETHGSAFIESINAKIPHDISEWQSGSVQILLSTSSSTLYMGHVIWILSVSVLFGTEDMRV
jgi:hypothetical protein